MSSGINPEILNRINTEGPPKPSEDGLRRLRDAVASVRSLEAEKQELESKLKNTNKSLYEFYHQKLPELLDEARVPEITIAAEGNMPEVTAKAQPYYHAVIQAEWPEERREAAFKWLEDNGDGDLIKTVVTVKFGKGELEKAHALVDVCKKRGFDVTLKKDVPWNSLTSWLKEQIEKVGQTPPLDVLGATVGRVVKLKDKT